MIFWLTRGRDSQEIIVGQHKRPGEGDGEIEVILNIYFKWLPLRTRRKGNDVKRLADFRKRGRKSIETLMKSIAEFLKVGGDERIDYKINGDGFWSRSKDLKRKLSCNDGC